MSIKLRRWHQRLGMVSALFVILLSVTGLLLNHTLTLQLDNTPIRAQWVFWLYDIEYKDQPDYTARLQGEVYISQWGRSVYINDQTVTTCSVPLAGAVEVTPGIVVLACEQRIILLTLEGELIDQMDETQGVPGIIESIQLLDQSVLVATRTSVYELDIDQFEFTPANLERLVTDQVTVVALPADLQQSIKNQQIPTDIDLERLILDLHSGRILGDFGVYLVDTMALLFLFMAFTGLWIWRKKP